MKDLEWDVFISYASEDRRFVRGLVRTLGEKGLRVWYDEFTLSVGDRLQHKIDYGLAHSKFGIVILSPIFFDNEWPQKELDGLATRESNGEKVILHVWHRITKE